MGFRLTLGATFRLFYALCEALMAADVASVDGKQEALRKRLERGSI